MIQTVVDLPDPLRALFGVHRPVEMVFRIPGNTGEAFNQADQVSPAGQMSNRQKPAISSCGVPAKPAVPFAVVTGATRPAHLDTEIFD